MSATDFPTTISYNSNGLIDTIRVGFSGRPDGVAILLYNSNNQLTDVMNKTSHERLHYAAGSPVSSVDYFFLKKDGGDSVLFETDTFSYKNGLVDKVSYSWGEYTRYEYDSKGDYARIYRGVTSGASAEYLLSRSYDYDDKICAFASFPFTLNIDTGFGTFSANYNPVVRKHNQQIVSYPGSGGDSTLVHYSYTYNSLGYTIGSQTKTTAVTFNYDCD